MLVAETWKGDGGLVTHSDATSFNGRSILGDVIGQEFKMNNMIGCVGYFAKP